MTDLTDHEIRQYAAMATAGLTNLAQLTDEDYELSVYEMQCLLPVLMAIGEFEPDDRSSGGDFRVDDTLY